MKNIFFLMIAVFCLQACSKDKEENWSADSLAVALSGDLISNGQSFSVGDGNWGMNVSPDLNGTFKLDIDTDSPWNISVEKMTNEEEEWLVSSAVEGTGKASVTISIEANSISEYRKASIIITTQGEIPVCKKITVVQKNLGILNVSWDTKYLLADELVIGPNQRTNMIIGTCDTQGDEIATYSTAEDWANISVEDGQIILNLSANEEIEKELREAILSLTNLNGGVSKTIRIKQYAQETFATKDKWSIKTNNANTLSQTSHESISFIDGKNATYWERQWNDTGEGGAGGQKLTKFPYEFLIDFGEAQLINTVDILQRLDWHTGCIKKVELLFSNNKSDWTNGGTYTLSQSKDECSTKKEAYSLSLAGVYQAKYMKLVLLANVWNSPQDAALAELSIYLK